MSRLQRPGYPNVSIKLYEDYDAWQENRFLELASTFISLTIRDGLFGRNEGMLQFYDAGALHTKMNGEQIIQISLTNANTQNVLTRIYGSKNFSTSVNDKGDNVNTINLEPIHNVKNLKFSRAFFSNATETVEEMIRVIYKEMPELAPSVNGLNIFVPRVPWVSDIETYLDFTREVGMSVDNESFVFAWEDISGINLNDYQSLTEQPALQMVVGEPRLIGEYVDQMDVPLAYDFNWLTKTNQYTRNPLENTTFYAHSFNDKEIQRLSTGTGENAVYLSRSGGYNEMTYRNGYEEALRLCTMAQYDGYAECKIVGNFEITPGLKINFGDPKGQFKTDFYVDEVIHEISNSSSVTNIYMFTNGKELQPVNLIKIKNTINSETADVEILEEEQPEATGNLGDAQWNLDILASSATNAAQGRKSTGDCALFVRRALEKAQIKRYFISGGLGHANQLPPRLVAMDWVPIGQNVKDFKKGDISVFNRTHTELGKKYGHVAIYNGSKWVSDFIQSSVQPTFGQNLTYTIYRARKGYSAGA